MKPLIGITASFSKKRKQKVNDTYVQAVLLAGGVPVLLPTGTEEHIECFIQKLDGFILTGGGDIDPILFNEEPHEKLGKVEPERDAFELPLVRAIIQTKKPLLGICRGMQMLNVALGGGVYQDLYAQKESGLLQHHQQASTSHASHFVQIVKGSLLEYVIQAPRIRVNSFHHQAVKNVSSPLYVCGVAEDGTIEAIESMVHPFVIGVQWHPEALLKKDDKASMRLFEAFIQKSIESRK